MPAVRVRFERLARQADETCSPACLAAISWGHSNGCPDTVLDDDLELDAVAHRRGIFVLDLTGFPQATARL